MLLLRSAVLKPCYLLLNALILSDQQIASNAWINGLQKGPETLLQHLVVGHDSAVESAGELARDDTAEAVGSSVADLDFQLICSGCDGRVVVAVAAGIFEGGLVHGFALANQCGAAACSVDALLR